MEENIIKDHQKTKIVATIGPASESYDNLLKLVKAGVDIFRLNFSHGTHEQHAEVIKRINQINEKHQTHVGILADLQGPKLRIGKIENNALQLDDGDIITFTNEEKVGTKDGIFMSYEQFAQDVKVGEKILVDDGKIVLEVIESDKTSNVKLKVLYGGILSSNKGVNMPDTAISLPSLTEKDLIDLAFMVTQPVHWIALSFVRKAADVMDLKRRLAKAEHPARVISKIEKPEALKNIKEIIKVSDAIMVARGDLGVEVPMEKLPALQKQIINNCIQKAKPVIVATQMMESMITNPSPSRAEVTDVANAVLDGTDAVMLSGETSVGKHPDLVVKAMNKIIVEAENHYELQGKRPKPNKISHTFFSDVICLKAAAISDDINAKALIGHTVSGYTAFKMSSFRPKCNIYIFSDRLHMLATLNLVWGVRCYLYDRFTTTDETVTDVCEILKQKSKVKVGDVVINTGSMPLHKRYRTNMMKITIVE